MPDRSGFDFPENYHEFELNIREHFRTSTRQKYNPLAKFINSLVHRGQRLRQMITPLLKLQLLSTNKLVDERSVPMIEDVEQPHLNGLFQHLSHKLEAVGSSSDTNPCSFLIASSMLLNAFSSMLSLPFF